ncbi:MAG: hypothetical protein WCJ37_15980 [Syntrophus sp. (in: bacteria)]
MQTPLSKLDNLKENLEKEGFQTSWTDPFKKLQRPNLYAGKPEVKNGNVIHDAVLVAKGEKYGAAIQYSVHYEFWEKLKPKSPSEILSKSRPYDAFPRGRIVFFPTKNMFIKYADRCISAEEFNYIMDKFEIDDFDFMFKDDEHYRCAEYNPFYME